VHTVKEKSKKTELTTTEVVAIIVTCKKSFKTSNVIDKMYVSELSKNF